MKLHCLKNERNSLQNSALHSQGWLLSKGCLSLLNYFIDMKPELMSPFFVKKTCFFLQKHVFFWQKLDSLTWVSFSILFIVWAMEFQEKLLLRFTDLQWTLLSEWLNVIKAEVCYLSRYILCFSCYQKKIFLTWEWMNIMRNHDMKYLGWMFLFESFVKALLSVEVKNSQVILRIVLPILTKFLQKSQICRALLQEVAKQSAE